MATAKESRQTKKAPPRHGRFSWLSLILLIVTLAGFIASLIPPGLDGMWNKTVKDLKKSESFLSFAENALRDGTLTITGEGDGALQAEAAFDLPGASLTVSGGETFFLSVSDGNVTLQQGEESASAPASYALASYDASSFAGKTDIVSRALRLFLLNSEGRADADEVWKPYKNALKRDLPGKQTKKVKAEDGSESLIIYNFDAKRLAKLVKAWRATLSEDKALLALTEDCLRSLYAVSGKEASPELIGTVLDFLSGADGELDRLEASLAAEKGEAVLSFRVVSERIRGITLTWDLSLGDAAVKGEAALDLGRNPAKSDKRTLNFTLTRTEGGTDKTLSLSLEDLVTDEKNNYKREVVFSLEDPAFLLLPATGTANPDFRALSDTEWKTGYRYTKLTFSRGKTKDDLILRAVQREDRTERSTEFRGKLLDYKKGKRVEFSLERLAVNGENRLNGKYTVKLETGGTPAAAPRGEGELFRSPEPETPAETPAEADAAPAQENP